MSKRRLAFLCLLFLLLPLGCRRMTEEEALEAAREEVKEEMRPEIERRQREIDDLKRQISEAKARLEAQRKAAPKEKPAR